MRLPRRLADWKKTFRLTAVAVGIVACMLAMHSALRIGQARALAKVSLEKGSLAEAGDAVRLSPDDPETYSARAISLVKRQEHNLAAEDLRLAITLRPRDYKLWADLGNILNRMGNNDAALSAMTEARTLAPFYAGPHWDTAVLLHKLDRQDEAFKEFRVATAIQPALFSRVIELAWQVYPEDCVALQRAVDPQTAQERWAMAHFFIGKGKTTEALDLIRSANQLPYSERRQFVTEFLAAKEFTSARELWAGDRGKSVSNSMVGTIDDGGFESGRLSDEPGFAWIENEIATTSLSIDSNEPGKGERSLHLKFQGGQDASHEIISQLVPVESNTHYHLSFMARAQDLLTGGAPVITVTELSKENSQRLAQSPTLPLGTSGWQIISMDFSTGNNARAVRITLLRQSCGERTCPIFGSLWLDDFALSTSNPNLGRFKPSYSHVTPKNILQSPFAPTNRTRGECMSIGEVAQAPDGSPGMAHAFIETFADAGADAVRFQTHLAEAESTPQEPWRRSAVLSRWREYCEGKGNNSFFVWQWNNLELMANREALACI